VTSFMQLVWKAAAADRGAGDLKYCAGNRRAGAAHQCHRSPQLQQQQPPPQQPQQQTIAPCRPWPRRNRPRRRRRHNRPRSRAPTLRAN